MRRLPLAFVALAAVLAGCGGGSSAVDRGGFTASERSAAQDALNALSQTAVATTAVQNVGVIGYPMTCVVHMQAKKPLTFKLFLSWASPAEANRSFYSWVKAVIGPDGLKRDYSFSAGNETQLADLQSRVGNATAKPWEPCEITNVGTFSLVPFGFNPTAQPKRTAHG